ncbi:hypothetical protein BMW22_40910 (plasmid) [Rhizobium leguminosarum]|uniref:Transposase n=1 Tax=Rhizobium leguminosarum TaxID=384 RepID=A0A1L3ZPS0_RHILE|nr:hypothetical protein BMW22_40910 [Rhizobium leguminosarum]
MSKTTNKFSPEVRAPAKIGCTAQTLSGRVKKAGVDNDFRPGLPSDVAERMKSLERENRELRQANEILRKASACFAMAELDRPLKRRSRSSTNTAQCSGRADLHRF